MPPEKGKAAVDRIAERMRRLGVDPRIREYVNRCVLFHGFPAPGVIIAVHMVEYATELLGKGPGDKIYAVCETRKCAPDPIQVILGSTAGNNRLRVLPIGRFALTLNPPTDDPYAEGVRVYVDAAKVARYPTIHAWFTNSEGSRKKEQEDALYDEIFRAGRGILSYERVRMKVPQKKEWETAVCPSCGEMIPGDLLENGVCLGCGSMAYYEKI
jgi:formylmethanofuran dehydrogenase subunit E